MDRESSRRAWGRWILGMLMAGGIAAAMFAGRNQASGAPRASNAPPWDAVVLTGSYSCSVYSYSFAPPPPPVPAPTPDPTSAPPAEPESDDPVLIRELTHYVSILGTGTLLPQPGVSPAPAVGPGVGPVIGPGFGGRASLGSLPPAPINLGSGVSAGFDGGTAEDCVRFGEAVAAVANNLGCVTSPLRTRQGIPVLTPEARFSFVCEGSAASQVHAIGELDRAVLAQRTAR